MSDYVLVLNAGSSSLKFSAYTRGADERWSVAATGQIEGIGTEAHFTAKDRDGRKLHDVDLPAVRDAQTALGALGDWLRAQFARARVLGVGHRVVHGGAKYAAPTIVTAEVLDDLRALVPLAPLHQPHNVAAIEACAAAVARRATSGVLRYELPSRPAGRRRARAAAGGDSRSWRAALRIPRSVVRVYCADPAHSGPGDCRRARDRRPSRQRREPLRAANRRSRDCSFGFTPLDGLCMGTRPGALDPGIVLYMLQTLGLSAKEIETTLYKKSGLLGISGLSNDMRDLVASDAPPARLAVDYFVYRAAKEIGAFAAVLGGVDGLVFTAGIGEHSAEIRARICAASAWLGIELDASSNFKHGPRISTAKSRVSAWVIPTNEEFMIARHTGRLLGLTGARAA